MFTFFSHNVSQSATPCPSQSYCEVVQFSSPRLMCLTNCRLPSHLTSPHHPSSHLFLATLGSSSPALQPTLHGYVCVCVWGGGGGSIVVGATSANSGTPPLVTSGPTPHRLGQILNDDVTALGVHCACAQSALGPYPYILLLDRVFERERERERSGDGGGGDGPLPLKTNTHTCARAKKRRRKI